MCFLLASQGMRRALAIIVAVCWTASFAVELMGTLGLRAAEGYHTAPAVHVLMGIVVGAMVGDESVAKARKRLAG